MKTILRSFPAILVLSCLFLIIRFPQTAMAGVINLPQTGQTTCWDTSGAFIPCAGTGQDGDIRTGVPWPGPRFVVSGDYVTDNLPSLMRKRKK
jgi:hypothetical protein